jgi:hypothetical protein
MPVMDTLENCAVEAVKAAMPFQDAEKLTENCARDAIQRLDSFNQKYMADNPWFDDGSLCRFVPMDTREIEPAVRMLSRVYLSLLHRRGLVGF